MPIRPEIISVHKSTVTISKVDYWLFYYAHIQLNEIERKQSFKKLYSEILNFNKYIK